MSLPQIELDTYGRVIRLELQEDGSGLDISSYTTLEYVFLAPSGTATTKTAAFDSDGTDGKLTYTIEDGLLDEAGLWRLAAQIAKTGVEIVTPHLRFLVT